MYIKCDQCGNEIKIDDDTCCALCGRKKEHNRSCPIYRSQFINGEPPNVYGGGDGKPINK